MPYPRAQSRAPALWPSGACQRTPCKSDCGRWPRRFRQRRCRIRATPDVSAGLREGLYDRAFSRATDAQRASGTTLVDPPTVSHIIAIAAPAHGDGLYSREQVETILLTAYTGFQAAALESH